MKTIYRAAFALICVMMTLSTFADPCTTIINISCGTPVTFAVPASAGDPMYPTGLGSCGTSATTNGLEAIYKLKVTATGLYQINTTSATLSQVQVQYSYKSAGLSCDNSGWICLGSTATAGPLGAILLNAGDSIYILANNSRIIQNQQTFQVNCAIPTVCNTIQTIRTDTTYRDTLAAGYGSPDFGGTTGPGCGGSSGQGGTEKLYKLVTIQEGYYQLNPTYYSTGIVIEYKDAGLGCDSSGFHCLAIGSTGAGNYYGSPYLHAGDSILILFNNVYTAQSLYNFNITVIPAYCDNIKPITCGVRYTFAPTIDSSQPGYMNGMGTNCFQYAGRGGMAQIYKLKAPLTGAYQLSTGTSSSGPMEYFYKDAALGCGPADWTCINYTALAISNLGTINMTAGDSILLLVKIDRRLAVTQSQTFTFSCPAGCPGIDTPAIVSSHGVVFCYGDSTTLSLSPTPIPDAVINWTYPGQTGTSYATGPVVTVHPYSGYITCNIAYCNTSVTLQKQVYTVNPLPAFSIGRTGDTIKCATGFTGFVFRCLSGFGYPVHYQWKVDGVNYSPDTSVIAGMIPGLYTLEITSGCGAPRTSTNSINAILVTPYTGRPHLSLSRPGPFCTTDTSVTLSIPPVPGCSSYQLVSLRSGSTYVVLSSTSPVFRYVPGTGYSYFIKCLFPPCSQVAVSDTLLVTQGAEAPISPFAISIQTPSTLCDDQGGVLLHIYTAASSYDWYADGALSSVHSSSISVIASCTVTASITNACGTVNSTNSVPVTIKPASPVTYRTASFCPGTTYTFYNQSLTAPGTYTQTLTNRSGCDSIISLALSLYPAPPTPTIVQHRDTMLTTPTYDHYNWYLYTSVISHAPFITSDTYGDYTVEGIDANGCISSASAEYFFFPVTGVQEDRYSHISLSPNPATNKLYLSGVPSDGSIQAVITDIRGRELVCTVYRGEAIDISSLSAGSYMLTVILPDAHSATRRFVKE